MICYFDNCICHQNCNCDVVLRDDARLVPCGSHLWAMQPMWSTATIEICHYKDPRHCTNLLVTLITLWLPYRFTLVSETDCVRHLPGSWPILPHWQSWEHSQGHYNCVVMGKFHALDGNKWHPHRCLVVRVCRIMVVSLVRQSGSASFQVALCN